MGDLQPYQEDAVDVLPGDTIMWFGKYEGRNWTISDIEEHDGRYARWLIEQPWQNVSHGSEVMDRSVNFLRSASSSRI